MLDGYLADRPQEWGESRAVPRLRPARGRPIIPAMERAEWLKAVYEAACRVAEKHGPGLRAALESRDDDGRLSGEVAQSAAEVIAGSREIWDYLRYSRHPEPAGDDWRRAPTFEGALIRAAVAALSADIGDVLEGLSTGRVPSARQIKAAPDEEDRQPGRAARC